MLLRRHPASVENEMLKNAISLELAPLDACLLTDDDSILAIIIGVEGPSYRPLGAMMTIFETPASVGCLYSGCVEADIKLHALECLKSGKSTVVRYGLGSPYLDIVLPCGGGLQIMLVLNPCRDVNHMAPAQDEEFGVFWDKI